jgi:hypothetical protein
VNNKRKFLLRTKRKKRVTLLQIKVLDIQVILGKPEIHIEFQKRCIFGSGCLEQLGVEMIILKTILGGERRGGWN